MVYLRSNISSRDNMNKMIENNIAIDEEDARGILSKIEDNENEDIYIENYMTEIMDRGERKEKRELLFLLVEGLESPKMKLKQGVLTILANSCERIGVQSFDLINIKCHIKILKLLSMRNPMEYNEDFLKYNILVLAKCVQDLSSVLIEDFKKEEKFISWKKVISILKHFMAKNKEEELKIGCCRIFLLLVKYQYFDDLV